MKLILTTFKIIFIIATFYGCGHKVNLEHKNDFPRESFSVIEATLNHKPVIGSFNMAYKNFDKKSKYPWCLSIYIALETKNLFENGLPNNTESEIAYKLEDELCLMIDKIATAHYVGHLFNETFLDIYIYLDEPEKVHKYLQTQINNKRLSRGFQYKISQDPQWETVDSFFK